MDVNWSDTAITARVAATSLTGIVQVQQNGATSNAKHFTVLVPGGNTLVPSAVTMMVGDTRTLQALNAAGQPATGLTWTSSDSAIVSLSPADPPLLTALAPGPVTITAGHGDGRYHGNRCSHAAGWRAAGGDGALVQSRRRMGCHQDCAGGA